MTRSREPAALLALLVGFAGCEGGPAPGARPAAPPVVRGVGVGTVAAVTVREGQDVVGTVRSKARMLIASKAQGYVREVHARPGDQVEPPSTSAISHPCRGDDDRRPTRGDRAMLLVIESKKPLPQVALDLEAAVARHKFGVLGVHDLRATMAGKGVDFPHDCRIFEVCNPHQAKKVLERNLEVSTALPCRISLYEEGGVTKLATIKPTAMLALYRTPELSEVAREVEETIQAIMAEAAR